MKYALIGCGRIAVNHISAAVNNKLNIIAVCDVIESKMEALLTKSKLNKDISIKKYTDYKQMLSENNDIELISIATESGLHAEIALYCIEQNINVIIEKPMAMSIADADRIIAAAEKHNVKVAACHQNRFNIAIQKCVRHWKQDGWARYLMVRYMYVGIVIKAIMIKHLGAEHGHRMEEL